MLGTSALLGTLFCWSIVPVFLRGLTGHVDAWTANAIRYPFAALLFWPVLVHARYSGLLGAPVLLRALVPAALSAGGQVLWAMAPYYLEASLIGFFIKSAILWAVVASMILFPDERALLKSRRFYAGMVLALAGFSALAITGGTIDANLTWSGFLIILACGVFFALYGVSVPYFLRGIKPRVAFAVVAQYVSIVTVILFFLQSHIARVAGGSEGPSGEPGGVLSLQDKLTSIPAKAWILLLVSSLLGIGISHVLFYIALHRLGATLASSSHLVTPFLTLAVANIFLGETMSVSQCMSGSVMLVGGSLLILAQETVLKRRALRAGRRDRGSP